MNKVKFKYRYNSDNIFVRVFLATLTEFLTERAEYTQVENDDTIKRIKVPFYVRATGDERFLYYHFSGENYENCEEKYVEGSIDKLPRGIISIESSSISREFLANPFSNCEFVETDDDGNLKSYRSEFSPIPLNFSMNLKIVGDTLNEVYKIFEKLLEVLYFNQTFHFMYNGMVVFANANFPDSISLEGKTFEFSYGNNIDRPSLNLPLECITFLPVIDKSKKIPITSRIEKFETSTFIKDTQEVSYSETYERSTISGKVYYANSKPYTGNLTLYDKNSNIVSYSYPNSDGEFNFVNLKTGINYKINNADGNVICRGIALISGTQEINIELE